MVQTAARAAKQNLYIKGEVETFALIAPKIIFLSGNAGRTIQSRITITPLKKYPFNIVESYIVINVIGIIK